MSQDSTSASSLWDSLTGTPAPPSPPLSDDARAIVERLEAAGAHTWAQMASAAFALPAALRLLCDVSDPAVSPPAWLREALVALEAEEFRPFAAMLQRVAVIYEEARQVGGTMIHCYRTGRMVHLTAECLSEERAEAVYHFLSHGGDDSDAA